ncbi:MAG: penicillin-binding protein 2 [Candidatus Omnitrophica bacterium]|nr:penicillin-binding protein 2 [Candidatus Omnitrophota bacterium]
MIRQKQEHGKRDIFGKRLLAVEISFTALFLLILLYLCRVQLINPPGDTAGKYAKVEVPVPRGAIYDRNGEMLAMSVPFYSLYLDSWEVRHRMKKEPAYPERLKRELVSILDADSKEISKKLEQRYPLIKKELSVEEYAAITSTGLPGTVFLPGYKRVYPNDRLACHIIGFAGTDGEGLEGLEFYYNSLLEGEKGVSLILKDGSGDLVYSVEKKLALPKNGKDICLTIDSNLQFIVEEEIAKVYEKYRAASVSAILLDYETGEILALANLPNYNPNQPGLFSASDKRNRAVTDLFEPGSTFKIVTAAAAIEEGIVSPENTIYCENGKWFVKNHYLRDVHPYKKLTVAEVIEKSSNIGTVKIAMELGEIKLYEYCKKFGFGEVTEVDLPGEIPGIMRPLNKWSGYSITAVPIGQEVGITAFQGIRAMGAVANGGYLINPHVLKEIKGEGAGKITLPRTKNKQKILSEETCAVLKEILQEATGPSGTASLASIPGYKISGKTGTAQKIINGNYSKDKYVASFVGFLNGEEAKMLLLVKVDEPKPVYYGGLVAAPVFRDILWRTLQRHNIKPAEEFEDYKIVMKPKI